MSPRMLALLFACLITSAAPLAQGHGGTTQSQAWDACEDLTQGEACDYENDHHDVYRGTCRTIQERLICVRNKPIEYAEAKQGEAHTHGAKAYHGPGQKNEQSLNKASDEEKEGGTKEVISWAGIPLGLALLALALAGLGWARFRGDK